jgi:hypothetical protein
VPRGAAGSPDVRALIVPHFDSLESRGADVIFAWQREAGLIEDVAQAKGLAYAASKGRRLDATVQTQ